MQEWLIDVCKNILWELFIDVQRGVLCRNWLGSILASFPGTQNNFFFQVPGNEASLIPQWVSRIFNCEEGIHYRESKPMPTLSQFRACHNMFFSKLLVQWWPLIQSLFLGGNDKFPNQWCWILRACLSMFVFWNLNSQILKLATLQSLAHSQAMWE